MQKILILAMLSGCMGATQKLTVPTDVVSYPFDLMCTANATCVETLTLDVNSTGKVDVPTLLMNVNERPADSWNFSLNLECHNGPQKSEVVLCNASFNRPDLGHCLADNLEWECPFTAITWTLTMTGTPGNVPVTNDAQLELEGHVFICPSESCNPTPTPATPPPLPPTPGPSSSSGTKPWPIFVGIMLAAGLLLSGGALLMWWQRTKGTRMYGSPVTEVAGKEMHTEETGILRSLPAGNSVNK
eukprot:TRINITY_DN12502_c0_g1_i1.p1 TRINITY_DN12502_c0_g1~~TRINITY_DN12502_c0_g1_i1.p1  ORF type:complete len:268 (+),score=24.93 TRINITY_DN12502_c0_g1_i1:74-805(+)